MKTICRGEEKKKEKKQKTVGEAIFNAASLPNTAYSSVPFDGTDTHFSSNTCFTR